MSVAGIFQKIRLWSTKDLKGLMNRISGELSSRSRDKFKREVTHASKNKGNMSRSNKRLIRKKQNR